MTTGNDWTFTNAGNRPAAITGAIWILVSDPYGTNDDCAADFLGILRFDLKPFVIQPKQVEIKHMEFAQGNPPKSSGSATLKMSKNFEVGDVLKLRACLVAFVNTPDDSKRVVRTTYTMTWKYEEISFAPSTAPGSPIMEVEPWILIRKTTNTLFN